MYGLPCMKIGSFNRKKPLFESIYRDETSETCIFISVQLFSAM